jgi:hypothetical protein
MKRWQINDNPQAVAERLGLPLRRVMEAVRFPVGQVMSCCKAGYTLNETVLTTDFPREFCLYVMKKYYAQSDKKIG